jgi:hypothetical protein
MYRAASVVSPYKGDAVQKGREFLRAQVNNTIMQHHALIESLEAHAKQADDQRYRELCHRYLPRLQSHQDMLEQYGKSIGASGDGGVKKVIGDVLGKARDTVDAMREDDFLRVVSDIVMIRQAQDTFATFAAVGETIGQPRLADIGQECASDHDHMQREFNTLERDLFVENAGATTETSATVRTRTEARP